MGGFPLLISLPSSSVPDNFKLYFKFYNSLSHGWAKLAQLKMFSS